MFMLFVTPSPCSFSKQDGSTQNTEEEHEEEEEEEKEEEEGKEEEEEEEEEEEGEVVVVVVVVVDVHVVWWICWSSKAMCCKVGGCWHGWFRLGLFGWQPRWRLHGACLVLDGCDCGLRW